MTKHTVKFCVEVLGNTLGSHETFVNDLRSNFQQVEVMKDNDDVIVIAFVPVVSRAGTDIEAALSQIPASQPAVLVVLFHTNDPYFVAPNSRLCVNRENVITVDCLFHEDLGLLRRERNAEALRAVKDHLSKNDSSPLIERSFNQPQSLLCYRLVVLWQHRSVKIGTIIGIVTILSLPVIILGIRGLSPSNNTTAAQPHATASAHPKGAIVVQPKDVAAVQPKDAVMVQPKDAAVVQPKDATVQPEDPAAAQPRDAAAAA
ncbi:uncharacterized protein LOC103021317 [Astyanax mexicanus]|uniref:uncharacterized protein LOC103021317 n=1 Tax=Astyanax mexicanus TaxID=7994 RepID=UPI0020CAFC43|nr:uncharacterized protein LOC103021317 [Astyanax mexicanus]